MSSNLRKRGSSKTDFQGEVQSTEVTTVSKVKRAANQTSNTKDRVKTNTRTLTRARRAITNKSDPSSLKNVTQRKKRTSRKKSVEQADVSIQVDQKKCVTHNNTKVPKKESVKKRKVIKGTRAGATSRQISLKESFLNQSKIVLRPRTKSGTDTPTKKVSDNKRKVPIYGRVSPEKSQIERNSEIYEFKFDKNDSKERVRKKVAKKKTIVKRKAANRRKKNISVKRDLEAPKADTKKPVIRDECESVEKPDPVDSAKEEHKETELKKDLNDIKSAADLELNKGSEKSDDAVPRKIVGVGKPTVLSVEILSNESVATLDNSEPSNPDDFKPFRPTNIFSNRLTVPQRNTFNCSLFEKSLSPIKRPTDNLQINNNSPWRVSPVSTLSQVMNVYQSTPQNNINDVPKAFPRILKNDPRQFGNVLKARNNLQKSNDSVICNTPKKKSSLISRKFGTEITNIDHSLKSKSSIEISERTSAKSNEDVENLITSNVNILKPVDKKSNILSPKKESPLKKSNAMVVKANVYVADEQKENLDPLPGPSGLKSTRISNEQHVLRQSNLNNFLNLTETPQSATIRTPHGIFDDPESISIPGKSLNKPDTSNIELKTAFGFDENSNPECITINNTPVSSNLKSLNEKSVARLSVNEIKNVLLKIDEIRNEHNVENVVVKKKVMKSPVQRKVEAINFSDTFDVLSEAGDTTAPSATEVPLFTDCEPVHFKEPPRYSYKRKQIRRFDFSDNESENEGEEEIVHPRKRKKTNKLKNQQDKRLIEWIKDINRTFHEIDEHELVVE
ncbi:muscle M-line assembly protein unc-89-like [Ceratina calcarata]|uniref:Muscle M-line assembly protein unc-89-like n=1 Tax=Ceratina calcarata TaxID=156304 RepID=A0AAJ7JEK2_9HYME|nr:muscle M-line assembly protein unc-89-like [Ceratina calcarata]